MMIGRIDEQRRLREAFESEYSEFVAVYGRRRVGKTFLVREQFHYKFTFQHTGLARKSTREQLQSFQLSLRRQGYTKAPLPGNWIEAFDMLKDLIEWSKDRRKVVFIDEMPWMDAPRSSFLPALENFWNSFASARKDVVLIACGSATSWIVRKLLKNKRGLHNRITYRIHLQPFTLNECEQYAKQRKLGMSRLQLMEGYMALGGIPYYWSLLDKSKSLAQNIDRLFFSKDGELKGEYYELYASLFNHPEKYVAVIETLGKKRSGLSREEIIKEGKLESNGKLSEILEDLENCGFIRKYNMIGMKSKGALYQLIDCYTLFYFRFIQNNNSNDEHFWSKSIGTGEYNSWCGLAFERLCLLHSRQIKTKLGISGIISSEYAWWTDQKDGKRVAQIDLLIDRNDGVINLCEMKYTKVPFQIDASYEANLLNKRARFIEATQTRKAVHITMVSSQGLERNAYADEIQSEVSGGDLFAE
jgi:AAA+ ATPase superfamily predicted ATPase